MGFENVLFLTYFIWVRIFIYYVLNVSFFFFLGWVLTIKFSFSKILILILIMLESGT